MMKKNTPNWLLDSVLRLTSHALNASLYAITSKPKGTMQKLKKLAALALMINFCSANAYIYKVINESDEVVQAHINLATCPANLKLELTLQPHTEGQFDSAYCLAINVNLKKGSEKATVNIGLPTPTIRIKPGATLNYIVE